ncbi:hypothetical protein KGB38_gp27 [Salmonella phage vB_SenS_SB28]|uniref:Uncharacterized protein n=1 Tax=Salmonella phage vB_SenS_SB28 TaxID=2591136 RepID=A0A5J6TBQ7_9CAUD|nr:hypothetical protein KGB38_gp27 [Salmonella phage vB_SenS_SB28]QFG07768.1 hypothetical protein [Salmonella phage vB_SenS_SB28]
MIPLLWVLSAYAFCRVLNADDMYQAVYYGALFAYLEPLSHSWMM